MDGIAKQILTSVLSSKLKESVTNTVKYNIYSPAVIKDMNSAQSLMAAYFNFLVAGDVTAAVTFLEILGEIPQMASSYIAVWLKDDFWFMRKDVAQALNTLAQIVVSQRISVNSPLVSSVTCLEEKYSLSGYFTQYVIVWAEHNCKLAAQVPSVPVTSNTSSTTAITTQALANVPSVPVTYNTSSATQITTQAPGNVPSVPVTNNTSSATQITTQAPGNVPSVPVTYNTSSATQITTQAPGNVPSVPVTNNTSSATQITTQAPGNVPSVPVTNNTSSATQITTQAPGNVPSVSVTSNTSSTNAITTQDPANVAADILESVVARNEAALIGSLVISNVNKITVSSHSLLFAALSDGDVEATAALCAVGAEWRDGEVSTLLKKALDTDSPGMIEALAKSGVDLSSFKERNGDTYLHLAAFEGKVTIVKAMLDGGVTINIKGYCGRTALHRASYNGHLLTVQLLLLRGAAVNAGDANKEIPLHWAAYTGHTEVIAALCAAGANVNRRDKWKKTPLLRALVCNKTAAAKLLRSKGGVK